MYTKKYEIYFSLICKTQIFYPRYLQYSDISTFLTSPIQFEKMTFDCINNSFTLIRKSYALYYDSLAWIRKKYFYSAKGTHYIAKDLHLFKKVLLWYEIIPLRLRVHLQKWHVYSRTNENKATTCKCGPKNERNCLSF